MTIPFMPSYLMSKFIVSRYTWVWNAVPRHEHLPETTLVAEGAAPDDQRLG